MFSRLILIYEFSVVIITFKVQACRLFVDKTGATYDAGSPSTEPDAGAPSLPLDPIEKDGFPMITKFKGNGKLARPDLHWFVLHARSCHEAGVEPHPSKPPTSAQDKLGCGLKDYGEGGNESGEGVRFNNIWPSDQEVHWNVKNWTDGIAYAQNDRNVSLESSRLFHMPDYCSRAIISELSTVYSRGRRKNSYFAGLGAVGNENIDPACAGFTQTKKETINKKVFNRSVSGKSCWNFVADYRSVYCMGYNDCECPNSSDEDCHHNDKLVDCCRKTYQNRIVDKTGVNIPAMIEQAPGRGLLSRWIPRMSSLSAA